MQASGLFKILKDSKRRVLQTVVEATDASVKTVDPEFEEFSRKFPELMRDMNECGAGLAATLGQQKKMFADSCELAKSLARIYEQNLNDSVTINNNNNTIENNNNFSFECHLQESPAAAAYCSVWNEIHNVIR